MTPRAVGARAVVLLVCLLIPAVAYALNLTSAGGFIFDVAETGQGTMADGGADAYDTCYRLTVNGTAYTASGTAAMVSADGRHIHMARRTIGTLEAERYIYVPAAGGTYARYVDIISNPGMTAVSATILINGNLGSDSSTATSATSSGDLTITADDSWFGTDDTDGSVDPSLAHVFQGIGGDIPVASVARTNDDISWTFSVTVPPGGRVATMFFAVQASNRANAHAEAARVSALPDDTLVGLDPYLSDIVNFPLFLQVRGPTTADEGQEISLEAVLNGFAPGAATWTWDTNGDGVFGDLPNAPTYVIPAGTTDGDDELIVGIEATDETATYTARKRIQIANVAPTITSEPPLAVGLEYQYQVVVEEPGGANDPLTFRMGGSPPPGMTIDEDGLIDWTPPPQARGRSYTAIVRVLDDDLGQDIQQWDLTVTENTPPGAPTVVGPIEPARFTVGDTITLSATNATDPNDDPLVYFFEVSPTSGFAGEGLVGSGEVDEDPSGTTSWTVSPALPAGLWYWRVWASDGQSMSPLRYGSFAVGDTALMPMTDAGPPADDAGAMPSPDAGMVDPPDGGCSVSSGRTSSGALAIFGLLALGLLIVRRRGLLGLLAVLTLAGCNQPPVIPGFDAGDVDGGVLETDAGREDDGCSNMIRDNEESHVDCGGPVCAACADGSNCRSSEDCESRVCSRGYCLVRSCEDEVRNGPEVGIDCGGDCGLCADGVSCSSNLDCESGHCRSSVCVTAECDDGRMNGRETDIDCGGTVCAQCATGAVCAADRDCESLRCLDGACDRPSCTDRFQNQDETSVDCGGAVCAPCPDGLACEFHLDCLNRRCHEGGCVSCIDRVQNGGESDLDCGGGVCATCADGRMCAADRDCRTGRCSAGLCTSCTDMAKNADESDVDCGGALCGRCPDRRMCNTGGDCTSGSCVDGVCISCSDNTRNGLETDVDCGGTCTGCPNRSACNVDGDCLSNACQGGVCVGIADTCARPWVLSAGANSVPWVANINDYLTTRPSCTAGADVAGPDLVLAYTATQSGFLNFRITKPDATRWVATVSSAPCGTVPEELGCTSEIAGTSMQGEIAAIGGTTYYFYVADTTSGANPLSAPLEITISEIVPECTPGLGGLVGTSVSRIPTGIPVSTTESFVVADDEADGYVYIGGTSSLYRLPKAGGALENVMTLAGLVSGDIGYDAVIAGDEIFTIDDGIVTTTNRVVRISADGGASWIPGGESYATFPVAPADDFRGATVVGSTMYLVTNETTAAEGTEIWSLPVGASSLPVTPTRLGTIPQLGCSGLAGDVSYLYTLCSAGIVKVELSTMTAAVVAAGGAPSTQRNAIAVDDTGTDGVADVYYYQIATEDVYYACDLFGDAPYTSSLAGWGMGTSNFGMALDGSSLSLYSYDDDTGELIVVR